MTTISLETFLQRFTRRRNQGDGNCFFESMQQLLGNVVTPTQLRAQVANYYATFTKQSPEDTSSLEYRIYLGLLYDNQDDDGATHHLAIRHNRVWASITDLLVCVLLYRCTIVLYTPNRCNQQLTVETISFQIHGHPNQLVGHLFYNGYNHFDALTPNTPQMTSQMTPSHITTPPQISQMTSQMTSTTTNRRQTLKKRKHPMMFL